MKKALIVLSLALTIFLVFWVFLKEKKENKGARIKEITPQLIESELETVVTENLKYYLYYPKEYKVEKNQKYPLLLFLHGGGESGAAIETVKSNGPPKLIAEGKDFPFLILAPQNPYQKKWWNTRAVNQLLDDIIADNRVDTDRIYITGLSRGGGAAWEMAVQYPEKFAAMAVVCGMTPVPYSSWINKELSIWVFHGDQDESIPISESIEMVDRLNKRGLDIKFTIYKGIGHNSWEKAYATQGLYEWFMSKRR